MAIFAIPFPTFTLIHTDEKQSKMTDISVDSIVFGAPKLIDNSHDDIEAQV